ncbi:MAG TPA: ABC transporter permease [Ignavibacteriaceae bacterium]|nr:ABC transporter permease [Ignavibacteriaceae bacterium]
MFKNYLKIALRNLFINKVYSFINITGLSVGLAVALLIAIWVYDEINYNSFHKNLPDIHRVVVDYDGERIPTTVGPMAAFLKDRIPEIINATRFKEDKTILKYGENSIRIKGLNAEPAFLDIFTFPELQGNCRKSLDETNMLVLTRSTAQKLFGNENAVGKKVTLANKWEFIVGGIVKDVPRNTDPPFDFEYLAPFKIYYFWRDPDNWNASGDYSTWVQLIPNADLAAVNRKITDLIRIYNQDEKLNIYLQPFSDIHLKPNTTRWDGPHGDIKYVIIFSMLAFVILSIVCINFINLSTARFLVRTKEIGIRKVVGASRSQIFIQGLIESFPYTLVAVPITILLCEFVMPYFNLLSGKNLAINYSASWLLIFGIGAIIFTGLLSSIYPAVFLSGFIPAKLLNKVALSWEQSIRKKETSAFRNILVSFQFALSITAIICTIIIVHQLNFIRSSNFGFDKNNLIYLNLGSNYNESAFTTFKTELKRINGVQNTSFSNSIPAASDYIPLTKWKLNNQERSGGFTTFEVDADYLKTMRISLNKGRFFNETIPTDFRESFVINQAAVKEMGISNPIGEIIEVSDRKGKIIGIVDNYNFETFRDEIKPLMMYYTPTNYILNIRVSPQNFPTTISKIEKLVQQYFPGLPFEWHFLNEQIDAIYRADQRMMNIFSIGSILAILISCLGLFGLVSFLMQHKTKEIGIRKILGASIPQVLILLSKDIVKLFIIANLVAWMAGYHFMSVWLQDFAYKINMQWWYFFLASGIALVIALVTVSFQAIKAATANPVESLRYE